MLSLDLVSTVLASKRESMHDYIAAGRRLIRTDHGGTTNKRSTIVEFSFINTGKVFVFVSLTSVSSGAGGGLQVQLINDQRPAPARMQMDGKGVA